MGLVIAVYKKFDGPSITVPSLGVQDRGCHLLQYLSLHGSRDLVYLEVHSAKLTKRIQFRRNGTDQSDLL